MTHVLPMIADAQNTGVAIFAGGFLILWLILAIAALVLWIWALIDIIGSSMSVGAKIVWLLVIFFLPLIGSIIYLLIGRGGGSRMTPASM